MRVPGGGHFGAHGGEARGTAAQSQGAPPAGGADPPLLNTSMAAKQTRHACGRHYRHCHRCSGSRATRCAAFRKSSCAAPAKRRQGTGLLKSGSRWAWRSGEALPKRALRFWRVADVCWGGSDRTGQTEVNQRMHEGLQHKIEKAHHSSVEEFIHNPVSVRPPRVRNLGLCIGGLSPLSGAVSNLPKNKRK